MSNHTLLNNLINDIYCRIGQSKIHGVGVIAIRDIPKGVNPFRLTNDKCQNYNTKVIKKEDLDKIHPSVRKMIRDFITEEDGCYYLPQLGLNSLDVSFYMNHNKDNNIDVDYESKCDYYKFKTNRIIKKDEELFINYKHYDV